MQISTSSIEITSLFNKSTQQISIEGNSTTLTEKTINIIPPLLLGMVATFIAAVFSGLNGVFLEKFTKGEEPNIWVINIQICNESKYFIKKLII